MCQQHSGFVTSAAVLFACRCIRILFCFIAFPSDTSTIVFIFICKMAHTVFLQGIYVLVCCSYLTLGTQILMLESLYLFVAICDGKVMPSFYFSDGLLMLMCYVMYHPVSQLLLSMWEHYLNVC